MSVTPPPVMTVRKDYLEELRLRRKDDLVLSDLDSTSVSPTFDMLQTSHRDQIRAEADRLISLATLKERKLRVIPLTHPLAITARERLSETLVSAVKAKLSLLQTCPDVSTKGRF